MEIDDEYIIMIAVICLVITAYTLINIFKFIPIIEKCNTSFEIINKCHCIPDENLAKLFNVRNYFNYKINYTNVLNNINVNIT